MMTLIKLSKYIARILRHAPDEIGLTLDADGWIRIDELLRACRRHGQRISRKEIDSLACGTDKIRFEIKGDKIRALHGHSVEIEPGAPQAPPVTLYHGTATANLDSIFKEGLKPGKRQFVHLQETPQNALEVGTRHGRAILLKIDAAGCVQDGKDFYSAGQGVWLTSSVPPLFLTITAVE